MSEENLATIERFYAAFGRHDGAAMEACYAPDVHFRDPVFEDLYGPEAGAMWRMLTGNATDLEIELASHSAEGDTGRANWIATYTFRTGRKVVNDIDARFRFGPDGLITRAHRQLPAVEVVAAGARGHRPARRLDADRPERHPPPGSPAARAVHGRGTQADACSGRPPRAGAGPGIIGPVDPIPLSDEDRAILDLEGPLIAGHTCKVMVLGAPPPSLEALRERVARGLVDEPLLRCRLGQRRRQPGLGRGGAARGRRARRRRRRRLRSTSRACASWSRSCSRSDSTASSPCGGSTSPSSPTAAWR